MGFLGGVSGKEPSCQCKRHGCDPWVGRILWRRAWQPTPVFLPGESHGHREPWLATVHRGHKKLDITEVTYQVCWGMCQLCLLFGEFFFFFGINGCWILLKAFSASIEVKNQSIKKDVFNLAPCHIFNCIIFWTITWNHPSIYLIDLVIYNYLP